MKNLFLTLLAALVGLSTAQTFNREEMMKRMRENYPPALPRRTILLVIDGLAVGAIEKFPLPALEKLKAEGTFFKECAIPLPGHPQPANFDENSPAYYPWSCSIPNPIMMTGTVFIGTPGIKETLLQYSYKQAGKPTAFVANDQAYAEIAGGYDTFIHDWPNDDDAPVIPVLEKVIKEKDPYFIRVHMQATGAGGYVDQKAQRKVWDENSEYRKRALKADRFVGEFVAWLKQNKFWDETVMIICGDHGQAPGGGNPPYEPDGNKTPLLILGKGIRPGAVYDYTEMINVAPTLAYLQDVSLPKFNIGRPLFQAFKGPEVDTARWARFRPQEQLNAGMIKVHELLAKRPELLQNADFAAANREFLTIEQIGTWHKKFTNLRDLLQAQTQTMEKLDAIASKVKKN